MKQIFVCLCVLFVGCATVKTKEDCIKECKARGAEYAGVKVGHHGAFERPVSDQCECK